MVKYNYPKPTIDETNKTTIRKNSSGLVEVLEVIDVGNGISKTRIIDVFPVYFQLSFDKEVKSNRKESYDVLSQNYPRS